MSDQRRLFVIPGLSAVIGFVNRHIPRQILAALLSIYLVTYVATAVIVYSSVRTSMLASEEKALGQLAVLKYDELVNQVDSLALNLTAWSDLDVMNDLVSGDIDKRVTRALEGLKRLYGLAGDIYAFDAGGRLLASSLGDRVADVKRLAPQWQGKDRQLVLVERDRDPTNGLPAIALAIAVYGNFDRSLQIGTLVLIEPWTSLESQLFSREHGTVLIDGGPPSRVLAANPTDMAERVSQDRARTGAGATRFVIGRSQPGKGLLANWQVLTVRESRQAIAPIRQVALDLTLLGAVLGIPIVLLGLWLSNRLTSPIADLTRVVREIAATDRLDARVPITSSDELGSLARSFNRMTDNLEKAALERERLIHDIAALNLSLEEKIVARTTELESAIEAQRRLIGDISHEIKSPLARLSMALGLARRKEAAKAVQQFDRMEMEVANISALASELLMLARLDGATRLPEFLPIDLGELVDNVVADALFESPERAPDVTVEKAEGGLVVIGNENLLRRAIENVVRNAIFYTEGEAKVAVALTRRQDGMIAVTVTDDGPGVPDSALAHLFEPFYRVDEARARDTGGSGIGLAICQRVIHSHGGTVSAQNNVPHGLVVALRLPVAPA